MCLSTYKLLKWGNLSLCYTLSSRPWVCSPPTYLFAGKAYKIKIARHTLWEVKHLDILKTENMK